MLKTFATVVLTAIMTSAFWIFAFGISRSPEAQNARVNGKVEGKGDEATIKQSAPSEFQLQQMADILRARLVARKIDVRCLEFGDVDTNLAGARQVVTIKQGIERELAKKIQAALKDAKLKVDSQINGDKLRVIGKKRDDLQAAMAVLRAGEFERPLQFENFRD